MHKYWSQVTETDAIITATFGGEISTHQYTNFRNDYNEIRRLLGQSNGKRLLVDLTETTFFGSLFIGIVLKLATQVRQKHGKMAICGLTPQLKELMQKLLLLERKSDGEVRLEHHPTREAAMLFLSDTRSKKTAQTAVETTPAC